ncbi:MipA/OmpV family protein [uncultured Enterovirga sp.]|uniref:MipA/OmpV family protein n=1 Tax=uncultured Enterovirga sp. TaxID=2026352 RepID=UPI0035CBE0CC
MTFRKVVLGLALVLAGPIAASAQQAPILTRYRPPPAGTSDTYIVTLSVTGAAAPSYVGSDQISGNFFPSLNYRRSDEPARFLAPDDGASISIIENPSLRFGPVFRFQSGRNRRDDRGLTGLRSRQYDVESGLFLEYWPLTFIRARIEARHGFRDDSGFTGNLALDYVHEMGPFTASIGPRLALGDSKQHNRYFGVSPFEAAINTRVGRSFRPDGGVTSVGALAAVTYRWNETWATTGFVGYDRLVSDAARSPIVRNIGSEDQFTVGLRVSYSFAYSTR